MRRCEVRLTEAGIAAQTGDLSETVKYLTPFWQGGVAQLARGDNRSCLE
jgi:hypothetical protein